MPRRKVVVKPPVIQNTDDEIQDRSPRDTECFKRAKARGQITFTLIEQDRTAPSVIAEWIKQNIETCPAEKLRAALDSAIQMRGIRKWPT